MTNPAIPDAAVEAAHRAWREQAALDGSIFEYNLRAALEAAAPHMGVGDKAEAWDEGMYVHDHYVANRHQGLRRPENPYRTTK